MKSLQIIIELLWETHMIRFFDWMSITRLRTCYVRRLEAVCLTEYPGSSSQVHKGWWALIWMKQVTDLFFNVIFPSHFNQVDCAFTCLMCFEKYTSRGGPEGSVAYMRGNPRRPQNNMLLVHELIMGGTGINRQLPSNWKPPECHPGKHSDVGCFLKKKKYLSTSFQDSACQLIKFIWNDSVCQTVIKSVGKYSITK